MQFGGDETDLLLDLPNALARPTTAPKQPDLIGIGLRIVGRDEAEQGGLARPIGPADIPSFSFADLPIDIVKNGCLTVADGHRTHDDDKISHAGIGSPQPVKDRMIEMNRIHRDYRQEFFCRPKKAPFPFLQPADMGDTCRYFPLTRDQ